MLTLLAVALLWPGIRLSELDLGVLFDGSNADTMGMFLSAFWPPEHGGEFLGLLWQATLETLAIATAGTGGSGHRKRYRSRLAPPPPRHRQPRGAHHPGDS